MGASIREPAPYGRRLLVVLSGQLSNPPRPLLRMLRGEAAKVTTHPKQSTSAPERQRQVHLPAQRQRDLIEQYKAGATQRELAGQYGVHRTTVTKILQRHGVEARRGLHPDLIDEAVRRYEDGQSLATVGRALGADPGTIKARLVERGVTMRDTHGRPR